MPDAELDLPHAFLDALDAGVIVLDRQRAVAGWNAWLAEASGVSKDQALGRRLETLFPESSLRRLDAAVSDALESGASSLLTHSLHAQIFPLTTRTGGDLVHNVLVRPVGAKPYPGCLVQIADVTASAHRERVLKERQKARYDAVVETAPDAIITFDAEGIIQLANPAASRHLGYPLSELIGAPIDPLFESRAPWEAAWRGVLEGESLTTPLELAVRRADGSLSYVGVTAARWSADSRVFVTAILRDVNLRRTAEAALRQLNQTLERRVAERTADRDRMWRLSSDLMVVAQPGGAINAINPAWTQLLGWSEPEVVGAPLSGFVAERSRPVLAAVLERLSENSAPERFELPMRIRDGGERILEWSAVGGDGLIQAVGRDVTAEREAARALGQAEEALRQAQKMEAIGQLTGGIAHDFNNLLTGIIGSMDVLKRRIAAGRYEDIQRFMDAAVTSANRAAALTHRLLAFARRQPLDPKPTDANRLIRGMEELLARTLGEQVRLRTRLSPDLWPVITDAHQLENAILNLAINGRDAMPEGGELTITTANVASGAPLGHGHDTVEPGDYTIISVADTGVGMAPEVIAKAFEPFFTTKPLGQGTGLGLSMIYGFVTQSRGDVRISSKPGEGTVVTLLLPRYSGAIPTEETCRRAALPQGEGETVLVVEDDAAVRLLIAEVLRELGYACIEASDGQAAAPMLTSNARLDLMVTDVGLPGLNGRQLAEIARQHRPDLKILFVTGYAEHLADFDTLLGPGMAMVTKPFALDTLAGKIREMIRG